MLARIENSPDKNCSDKDQLEFEQSQTNKDLEEVLKVLKLLGKKVDDKRFWEVFRDLDLDNSSSLEMDEFQIVMDTLARKKLPNAGMQVSDRASRCNCSPLPPFCC